MQNKLYSLGLDFGTSSVRAVVIDLADGTELASAGMAYPSGEQGVLYDADDPHLARQEPADYLLCMELVLKACTEKLKSKGLDPACICGIGVDTTASTPIPVDQQLQPLSLQDRFRDNLHAKAWLWKDHTATSEAEEITRLAASIRPEYLERCGGTYSSEWFYSKILHCIRVAPDVHEAAHTWLEQSDFIPAQLCGINDISQLKRNRCAAGHKALYSAGWGGFPDPEFLTALHPALRKITLSDNTSTFDTAAGILSNEWAARTGLPAGIPVATGSVDAHVGALGAGVSEGTYVLVTGTSSCGLTVSSENVNINGISGIAQDSILPGFMGIESGQAAVGDLLNWFVSRVLNRDESAHEALSQQAALLKPGESGLLALDWNNGNRNVLADPLLSGLILGQTLGTRDYEIYRALMEATGFGALRIIEQIESSGVSISKVICCGGIAIKNPLFMQIYADIFNREIHVAASAETVATGAAIMGAYCALKARPGYENLAQLQQRICRIGKIYKPEIRHTEPYRLLYGLYKELHDAFGVAGHSSRLHPVMKKLFQLKASVR